jgi:hypothetical protein
MGIPIADEIMVALQNGPFLFYFLFGLAQAQAQSFCRSWVYLVPNLASTKRACVDRYRLRELVDARLAVK